MNVQQWQTRCPNCGYCPHCGRGDYPRPWQPWYQKPWYSQMGYINHAQGTSGNTATFTVK